MIAVCIRLIYTADPQDFLPCWLDGGDPFQPVRRSRVGPEVPPVSQPMTTLTIRVRAFQRKTERLRMLLHPLSDVRLEFLRHRPKYSLKMTTEVSVVDFHGHDLVGFGFHWSRSCCHPITHLTDEPHQTDLPVRVGIPNGRF
jgi:hypothetical protein